MISNIRQRDSARQRLLWSLLASVGLNISIWVTYPHLSLNRDEQKQTVVVSRIRIEHRSVPHPHRRRRSPPQPRPSALLSLMPHRPATQKPEVQKKKTVVSLIPHQHRHDPRPRAKPKPTPDPGGAPSMSFTQHQAAALKLPVNWDKQDFANGAAANTTLWLDFKKARGAFVPRVFLLQLKTTYLSGPSLQDAIHDILMSLREDAARVTVSRAQRVCGGKRLGWYLSYERPRDDPPAQFENILFLAGDTVYRVIYSRPVGQAEDAKTRAALNTLCPL